MACASLTGGEAAAEPGLIRLEEVVVTARKKQESVQDVPLSVTAFTADKLIQEGITGIDDIAQRTPGLNYGNFGDRKLSPTSLRGVTGSAGSAGSDGPVGFYLDEVYLGQGVGATIDLFDLESVEVLRGPQGTLFGRNTVGGLVHYKSALPTEEFSGYLNVDLGESDYTKLDAAISGALVEDTLLGRLSVFSRKRDGTSRNVVLGRDVNSIDSRSLRGQLQFLLDDVTEWRISVDYNEINQDSLVFETLNYNSGALFPALLDQFGQERNLDAEDRRVFADAITPEENEAWGFMSHFATEFSGIEFVNVTSYRSHDYENRTDTDRSALAWMYDGDPEEVDRWSTEFRFSGEVGQLQWVAGAFYFEQDSNNLSFIEIGRDLAGLLGDPSIAGLRAGSDGALDVTSEAVFGSLTWSVSDKLDVSLGGRYTAEEKTIAYSQNDPLLLLGGSFSVRADESWDQFTPSFNARYHFSPDIMGYLTVSEGFKSGGFNDALGDADGISFDPETLWNYEAGMKSAFLDGRGLVNLSVFFMDWKDIQASEDNPNTPVYDPITTNAGEAESKGVELELSFALTEKLLLSANGALIDAEYLNSSDDYKEIAFAPDYTANISLDYRVPVAAGMEFFFAGGVIARGDAYLTSDGQKDGLVKAYEQINVRFGLAAIDGKWQVGVWGRNLTDEVVKQRLFDLSSQDLVGQKFVALNDPAMWGVNVRYDF